MLAPLPRTTICFLPATGYVLLTTDYSGALMPAQITMPQQSDTMTEGTVVKWRKKEGDKVKAGEIIAEIETDKAVMEMESSSAGTLAALLVGEGQKVPVGTTLAVVAAAS